MLQRLTLIAIAIALSFPSLAQKEFASLPAKVKLKMAQEEEIASEGDPVFQTLMSEGMTYFEDREFDKAISKFEEAGARRPINVYPPVMIEDVTLARSLPYEEAVTEQEPEVIEEPISTEPEITAEERVEKMYQEELAKVYAEIPKDPPGPKVEPKVKEPVAAITEGIVVRDKEDIIADGGVLIEEAQTEQEIVKPDVVKETTPKESIEVVESKSITEIRNELADEFPDGITEEVFTEGNRTITKRVVVKDGKGDEYRKVKHGWGGVFYFKNGTSITERVWKEDTE